MDADPGGAQPARVEGGTAGDHRDRAHLVAAQVVDGGDVEARGVEAEHGHVRLAGASPRRAGRRRRRSA